MSLDLEALSLIYNGSAAEIIRKILRRKNAHRTTLGEPWRTRGLRRCSRTPASPASRRREAFPSYCAPELTHQAQAKARVEIDERFKGVFNEPRFRRRTVVDKRGRRTEAR